MIKKVKIKDIYHLFQKYGDLGLNVKGPKGFHKIEACDITSYNSKVIKIETEKGIFLNCSPDHLIKSGNGSFIKSIKLHPGKSIDTINGRDVVKLIELLPFQKDLYDIQVKDVKEYYANNITVHNSSIFFSLMFNLFKTTSHPSLNIEDIINKRKTKMDLWCTIRIGTEKYFIKRTFKYVTHKNRKTGQFDKSISSKLIYYKELSDGTKIILNDDGNWETERRIRSLFGTAEYFKLTSYSQQNNSLELIDDKRGKERKEILSKFLGLDIFSSLKELGKNSYDIIEKEVKNIDIVKLEKEIQKKKLKVKFHINEINELQNKITTSNVTEKIYNDSLEKLRNSLHLIDVELMELNEDEVKNKIQAITFDIRSHNNKNILLLQDRTSISSTLEKIKKTTKLFSELSITMKKVTEIRKNLYDIQTTKKIQETKLLHIDKEIEILNTQPWCHEAKCVFLQNALEAEKQKSIEEKILKDINNNIIKINEWLKTKEIEIKKYDTLTQLQQEIQRVKDKFIAVQQDIIKVESTIKEANSNKTELINSINKLVDNKKKIIENKQVQQDIKKLQQDIKNIQSESMLLVQNHTKLVVIKEQLEKSISDKEYQCTVYKKSQIEYKLLKYYIKALDVDGIPLNIIRSVLPIINTEINKLLITMDFSITFETNEQGSEIYTYITDDRSKKKLESGSGAEKMLAGLAIRCALISLSSLPKPNFIIIDEGFGSLDSTNLNNLGKLFEQLKQQFEHVIIISHISDVLDFCDNQISITLDDNGYSVIQ